MQSESLTELCIRLCSLPEQEVEQLGRGAGAGGAGGAAAAYAWPTHGDWGSVSQQLHVRLRALALAGSRAASADADAVAEALRLHRLMVEETADPDAQRQGLLALSTLLQQRPCCVDHRKAYQGLSKVLARHATCMQPAYLAAAMQLASSLAAASRTPLQQQGQFMHTSTHASAGAARGVVGAGVPHQQKRVRREQAAEPKEAGEPQHLSSAATAGAAGAGKKGGYEPGRRLTEGHVEELHRALVQWAAHWHPRVKSTALEGLLQLHCPASGPGAALAEQQRQEDQQQQQQQQIGQQWQQIGQQRQPGSSSQSAPSSIGPTSHLEHVAAAYEAAVTAIGDDHAGVRSQGVALVAVLACTHGAAMLPGPRWAQFGLPLPLVDDAFQRLCACIMDNEHTIRREAMQALTGLRGACTRVKLQVLSKKATVAVPTAQPQQPSSPQQQQGQAEGSGLSKRQQKQQQKQQQGKAGGAQGAATEAPREYAWAGGPEAKGLDLLDASVGALVQATEDESSQVRLATASAMHSIILEEVLQLLALQATAAGPMAEGAAAAAAAAAAAVAAAAAPAREAAVAAAVTAPAVASPAVTASRRQVCMQCSEYLVDLLHDEVLEVRLAAAQALAGLAEAAAGLGAAQSGAAQGVTGAAPGAAAGKLDVAAAAAPAATGALSATGSLQQRPDQAVTPVSLLDREQVMGVIDALADSGPGVRSGALRTLSCIQLPSPGLMKALAQALAACMARFPEDKRAVLAAARACATYNPGPAKSVAVAIAQQHQVHQQQQSQQAAGGPDGGADRAGGAQAAAGAVTREQLMVMQALVQGIGGL